jgi:hypothetical protein
VRTAAALHVGCIGGALPEADYLVGLIRAVGFAAVRVAEAKPIDLPDEALAAHLTGDELAAFRASGVRMRSVTLLGTKPG